ncbi:hypothetical protein Tco_0676546 [Tanacetum coccineum]
MRDLPGNPLVSVEVLSMIKKEEKVRIGNNATEMELTLEQTQQWCYHGTHDSMHNPLPANSKSERLCFKTHGDTLISIDSLTRVVDIEKSLSSSSDHKIKNIRVNSFTMKMEILLESTSNKLMVGRSSLDLEDGGEHVGPEVASPQGAKLQDGVEIVLVDDLRCLRSQCQILVQGTSSIPRSQ